MPSASDISLLTSGLSGAQIVALTACCFLLIHTQKITSEMAMRLRKVELKLTRLLAKAGEADLED